jgi:DNA processing protein
MMRIRALSDAERADWLRLFRSRGVGPQTFRQLLVRFGSAAEAIDGATSLARSAGRSGFAIAQKAAIAREIDRAQKLGIRFIAACEPAYPKTLRAIPDPPPVIGVRGDASLLLRDAVAIVGARNASAAGRRIAASLAGGLGQAGLIVVSGLARGIDGAAHEAALNTGTVAVVAGGLDTVYPPEHDKLMAAVIERGAVVSEAPLGLAAKARDFPKRNRIVSGLSLGLVVVEAAERSGTLITARLAAEQGREVFAVPGSPLDPRSHGTNALIKHGAILTAKTDDVIEGIRGVASRSEEREESYVPDRPVMMDTEERAALAARLLSLMSYTPIHRDVLVRESGAGPAAIADALLDLVLTGRAAEMSGGFYVLGDDEEALDPTGSEGMRPSMY